MTKHADSLETYPRNKGDGQCHIKKTSNHNDAIVIATCMQPIFQICFENVKFYWKKDCHSSFFFSLFCSPSTSSFSFFHKWNLTLPIDIQKQTLIEKPRK